MELQNNYLKGSDEYPQTMTAAYNLLVNWKQDPQIAAQLADVGGTGVAFAHLDEGGDCLLGKFHGCRRLDDAALLAAFRFYSGYHLFKGTSLPCHGGGGKVL